MGSSGTYLESVDNALRLVLLLAQRGSLRVSDAARELGLAPSTTHRLLATLRYRGFAVQHADRTYLPGPAFAELGTSALTSPDLVAVTLNHLQGLRGQLDETCHLVVRIGREVRFLTSIEAQRQLRVAARTGALLPAHRTSGGKALLAELSSADLEALYPAQGVPEAGLDADAVTLLRRELRTVRRRRYALNKGDTERGIAAVGMAIHGPEGLAVGAISVSAPTVRFSSGRLEEWLPIMHDTVAAIDADLR